MMRDELEARLAQAERERDEQETRGHGLAVDLAAAVKRADGLYLKADKLAEELVTERARADRLEAACAAMREALRAVEWSGETEHLDDISRVYATCPDCSGLKPCDEARALLAAPRRFAVDIGHYGDCTLARALHPDAGGRLLARLEAAERVSEACDRWVRGASRFGRQQTESALAAWRAAKEESE